MPLPDSPARKANPLFPEIEPHANGWLAVDGLHELYWETCGNPRGVPVVFLHGGPGGGCLPHHRRFFDPGVLAHRAVRPARRGPLAPLGRAPRQHDAAPRRRPRAAARAPRRSSAGWSSAARGARRWRSPTREAHPERCLGLVLRGIFLARPAELDWFLHGMGQIFPEAWRAFAGLPARSRARRPARQLLPPPDRSRSRACTCRPPVRGTATRAPARRCCRPTRTPQFETDTAALAIARIEAHYFVHGAFLGDDQLLRDVARIRHLPCTIVQGRYDIVCPPVTADALARAWPEAELRHRARRRPLGARAGDHARARRGRRADARPDVARGAGAFRRPGAAPSGCARRLRRRRCRCRPRGRRRSGSRGD